jgi:hypothetical protein
VNYDSLISSAGDRRDDCGSDHHREVAQADRPGRLQALAEWMF